MSVLSIQKRAKETENTKDPNHKIFGRAAGAIRRVQSGTASRGDFDAIRQGVLRLRRVRDTCFCDYLGNWDEALSSLYPGAPKMSSHLAFERVGGVIKRVTRLASSRKVADENNGFALFFETMRNATKPQTDERIAAD